MNSQLSGFARQTLKDGLQKCTQKQQLLFKRMYSHKDLDKDVNDVVDQIHDEKLDWAMQQIQRTLDKNREWMDEISAQKNENEEKLIDNERDFYAVVREERDKLRAFALEIMDRWPNNGVSGDDLQDLAERHGFIKPETRYGQCGESCQCSEYVSEKEFESSVVCFRKTELLTGGVK